MVFSFGKSKLEVRLGDLGLARETGSGFVSNCTVGLFHSSPKTVPQLNLTQHLPISRTTLKWPMNSQHCCFKSIHDTTPVIVTSH